MKGSDRRMDRQAQSFPSSAEVKSADLMKCYENYGLLVATQAAHRPGVMSISGVLFQRWYPINTAENYLLLRYREVFADAWCETGSSQILALVAFDLQIFV